MARRVVVVSPEAVKAMIAQAILECDEGPANLGEIVLRPHQRNAVGRIERAIGKFGGALLADAVGLGKTFVALAVARGYTAAVVVAPAVLRSTWADAARRAVRPVNYVGTESLGRREPIVDHCDLVIVDEAHHFRSPATKRYARLARLIGTRPVLLLSATPVHNRRDDLLALLALFMGSGARELGEAELARCLIRRETADLPKGFPLPAIGTYERIEVEDDQLVAAILSLPPPLPPRDGGAAETLIVRSLVHQWASSRAALTAAIHRRITGALALVQALESGRFPTRRELNSWLAVEDSVQLGFSELLVDGSSGDACAALTTAQAHLYGLRRLREILASRASSGRSRADIIREIRRRHPHLKIVAFSQYAATIESLVRELSADGGIVALTGRGGYIASGPISRDEALRLFRREKNDRLRADLLLATDLLSEGVNIPEASVVVHLDIPWTAARLEQRVGRLRRLGSSHDCVHVYELIPPASAERLLGTRATVERKAAIAARVVGLLNTGDVRRRHDDEQSAARDAEWIRARLGRWRRRLARQASHGSVPSDRVLLSATLAARTGFLALLTQENTAVIIAGETDETVQTLLASDTPSVIRRVMHRAEGVATTPSPRLYRAARRAIRQWVSQRTASVELGDNSGSSSIHRRALERLQRSVETAPIHKRCEQATRLADLAHSLAQRLGAGREREIQSLLDEPSLDAASFARELGQVLAGVHAKTTGASPQLALQALLLCTPPTEDRR